MIRNNVKQVGEALGYNATQVAREIGASKTTMNRVWNGALPTFEVADKLCAFFKCRLEDLFEYIPDDQMSPGDYEELEKRRKMLEQYNSYRK